MCAFRGGGGGGGAHISSIESVTFSDTDEVGSLLHLLAQYDCTALARSLQSEFAALMRVVRDGIPRVWKPAPSVVRCVYVHLCVCVCVCVYLCVHVCVHAYMCMWMCMYVCICMCMCVCECICAHVYVCVHVLCIYMRVHVCVHVCACVCVGG